MALKGTERGVAVSAKGVDGALGEGLRAQAHQLFHGWHWGRDAPLTHARVAVYRRSIQQEGEQWLVDGHTCGVPNPDVDCRESLTVRQAWWTFVCPEGGQALNNAAERAIRPSGIGRKGRFGLPVCENHDNGDSAPHATTTPDPRLCDRHLCSNPPGRARPVLDSNPG